MKFSFFSCISNKNICTFDNSIPFNASDNRVPTKYMRSEEIIIETKAELDCGTVYNRK